MAVKKVSFNNKQSPFYDSVKQKVEAYFLNNNIAETGNFTLYLKSIILLPIALFCYIMLVFFLPSSVLVSILLCLLLGVTIACIGFNIMHDGAHGSYSKHKWLNNFSAHTLSVIGGSAFMWRIKHNVIHHSYTNIHDMDDDLNNRPFFRITSGDPKYKMHRFQHYYWIVLYMLSYTSWVFAQDFVKYFTGKIGTIKIRKMNTLDKFKFWITKFIYLITFIGISIYTNGILNTVVGYLITALTCGFVISLVFQLAHVVGVADFPQTTSETNKIEQEWAIHQVNTTVNFATKNKFVSWFIGGLNFQVEHHLFPKVSHVHYPQISKIVKETCEQFHVPYLEHPTVFSAIQAHVLYLKDMGKAV